MHERRIRVGEPALLQGDERDVIVISTVVSDVGGRAIGPMTSRIHAQAINVAASRARDQMWVLHSVPAETFSRNDERAALIRHCSDAATAEEAYIRLEGLVDARSPFEREVLRALIDRGYRAIRPQHKVGRYLIDFVIEGPDSRLALECDGEQFHGPEQWDSDRDRQETLERAGWTFVRIRGARFYRDPAGALEPLWARLDELGIPTGDWATERLKMPPIVIRPATRIDAGPSLPAVSLPSDSATGARRPDSDAPVIETVEPSSPVISRQPASSPPTDPWEAAFRAADEAREQTPRPSE
jgi:very-short-patch-repair endonuclease